MTDKPPAMLELPEPSGVIVVGTQALRAFTADQMRAYALAALQSAQPAAAVSDEEIRRLGRHGAWRYKYSSDPAHSSTYKFNDACLLQFARAILALRPAQQSESKTYSDGTTATGPAPLPEVSPAEQDANLAESLLIDLESMLGQRSGASIKLRSLIRSMRPAQQAVPMTEEQIVAALKACDREDPSKEGWIWRTRIKWARAIEAHHGITAQGAQEGV